METIVQQFKKCAKRLAALYKERKQMNLEIRDLEVKLCELGKVIEFADSAELAYKSKEKSANG